MSLRLTLMKEECVFVSGGIIIEVKNISDSQFELKVYYYDGEDETIIMTPKDYIWVDDVKLSTGTYIKVKKRGLRRRVNKDQIILYLEAEDSVKFIKYRPLFHDEPLHFMSKFEDNDRLMLEEMIDNLNL